MSTRRINLRARSELTRRRKKDRMPIATPRTRQKFSSTGYSRFLFETVRYLIVRKFSSSRMTRQMVYTNPVFCSRRPVGDAESTCKILPVYGVNVLITV